MSGFRIFAIFTFVLFYACHSMETNNQSDKPSGNPPENKAEYALVIHGGAGIITRDKMTDAKDSMYRAALDQALLIGEKILKEGGSALDAVVATVVFLEDTPHFNAGKGAVFTHEGTNELDASIMDGQTKKAGAVGGVSTIKNPIKAARAVMDQSNHVMLIGKGAEAFAKEAGLELVDPAYFHTPSRWNSLQETLEKERQTGSILLPKEEYKFGTVGCVALDKAGNLAAGTSTGGMTNKRWNRIGDSPIIGAGTYADNQSCAVSSTGHGEFFIRYAVAHDIAARMEYLQESLEEAAHAVVMKKLVAAGGEGGIIAVDKRGNVAMPHNSPGMYRGYVKPGVREVKIFGDE